MQKLKFSRLSMTILGISLIACFDSQIYAQTSVLTQHNDISRTGQNLNETILTPANVSSAAFGKLFNLPVDGGVLAQPLYVPRLSVAGVTHNVLFVATEHDTVYAFDADEGAILWQESLLTSFHGAAVGATSEPSSDTGCLDLPVEYGVTGTPVIDPASGTIYLVSDTSENGYPVQRLHALDITTGMEKFGGPVTIKASVIGSGTGSSNGIVSFDPKWENQRAGLLLVNGTVYIGFGAHCDFGPFHGWLLAYDATTLVQTSVFMTTPNGEGSGIWMGGSGLAADIENGETRLFLPTGNGTYDATTPYQTNSVDYGDDILRLNLSAGLVVEDAFTPKDQGIRVASDTDLGSGGAIVLPDQPGPYPHLLLQTGKGSEIYLVNRDNLGGYSTTANNIVQELDNQDTYLWGMPAYWNGNIYTWTAIDQLRQFSLTDGLLSQTPVAVGLYTTTTGLGSTPSISANGASDGILWVVDWTQSPEILYALDASNVANTLWSSSTNGARDSAGPSVKYVVPTIVNGKVYIASASSINVYGLISSPDFSISGTPVAVEPGQSATATINVTDLSGFAGAVVLTASNLPSGVSVNFSANNMGTSAAAVVSISSALAPGNYPITITGTSGPLSHSITLPVQVLNLPSFSVTAASTSVAIQQGMTASDLISISPVNGFGSGITLTVSGLPNGVTAVFSPTTAATSSTLTFTASPVALVGTFPISVKAESASITQTLDITLMITHGLSLTNVQLINLATGVCFDVNGISKAAGVQIGQANCWGGPNQLWNLASVSPGVYQVVSVNSGLVLDISASSALPGSVAIQNINHLLTSQQWKLQGTSDGYFNLVNLNSSQCLDGVEDNTGAGDETQQQACSGVSSQKWSLVPLSATTTVNLAPWYNVNAISQNGQPTLNGGIDAGGEAFSVATVGSGYNWYGYSFTFGPPSIPDAVTGSTIYVPVGQYNGVYLLALASDGSRPNQTFFLNYSDGTSTRVVQGIHDWGPQATLYPGEQIALTVPYRLLPSGKQDPRPFNIYGYHFGLDSTKTLVSIALPNNVNVCILAMTLGK